MRCIGSKGEKTRTEVYTLSFTPVSRTGKIMFKKYKKRDGTMAPSLLLYYRGTSPSVKSRSGQGICFCAQVVPARGNSIAARAILPCTGNLSAGRCLCNCCERSTQVCLMLIFGTQAFFTYFRYRSINVKNLRPLEFAISGFSMTSSLQSGFQRDEDLCKTSLYT